MANRDKADLEPVEARKDVEALMNSLAPKLRLAGVPETQINVAVGRTYRLKHFLDAYDWLHQFSLSAQYEDFVAAYDLRPPEVWAHYAHIGVEGLAEQILLQEAGLELVKRWRVKRPRMFGKDKKIEKEQESEQNSDRTSVA